MDFPECLSRIIFEYNTNVWQQKKVLTQIRYRAVIKEMNYVFQLNEVWPSKIVYALRTLEEIFRTDRSIQYQMFVLFGNNEPEY